MFCSPSISIYPISATRFIAHKSIDYILQTNEQQVHNIKMLNVCAVHTLTVYKIFHGLIDCQIFYS